ncbi:hypothetical protein PGT21_006793 [Puccinia graminis f. sp. tritici]|uniref:Enoyl CoA hydratase n=1 Tax=Puccinia graminis f. sp. tritici TaxID=56615 RepID=A0A5B0RBC0_PUCGR|nr:hypothetical protein PGT21_006793 [Puccinia graminis f. sp. tritici]KAA1123111.1 hypothetical protein PGTUg99_009161 [Puccinia graminis f. sp. tritici]
MCIGVTYLGRRFSSPFWSSLGSNFAKVRQDPNVRAVILCSNTRAFTAGLDLKEDSLSLVGADSARSGLLLREHVLEFQAAISKIEDCERPVIVAIHGVCYGLGIDIIAACDIRLCDSKAQFSIKEVDAGIAADIGTLQRLPKKTGNDSLLRELALTARSFGPQEACELGLIAQRHVVEGGKEALMSKALQLAQQIASKSPIATLGTKHLLNYSTDHTVNEGLNYTALWSANALQATDVQDAIQAVVSAKNPKPANFKRLGKL